MDVSGSILRTWMPAILAGMTKISISMFCSRAKPHETLRGGMVAGPSASPRCNVRVVELNIAALLLGWRFYYGFHVRQSLLELATDHFVHIHNQVDRLGHEIFFAEHAPGDQGLILLGLKGELGGVSGCEGL